MTEQELFDPSANDERSVPSYLKTGDPLVAETKRKLLADCRRLERRVEVYSQGGFSVFEMAKFSVFAGYTLVRAVEPLEEIPDSVKREAIEQIVPALVDKYPIDIPGIPFFLDDMIRGFLLNLVVKAIATVLLKEHYNVTT